MGTLGRKAKFAGAKTFKYFCTCIGNSKLRNIMKVQNWKKSIAAQILANYLAMKRKKIIGTNDINTKVPVDFIVSIATSADLVYTKTFYIGTLISPPFSGNVNDLP